MAIKKRPPQDPLPQSLVIVVAALLPVVAAVMIAFGLQIGDFVTLSLAVIGLASMIAKGAKPKGE